MKTTISVLTFIAISCASQAQTWNYSWDSSVDSLDGNNDAGTWQTVKMSQNTNTGILSVKITTTPSGDSSEPTNAMWMSITNGPTPTTTAADYAGIYMYGGNFFVTAYDNSPVLDHQLSTVITQGSYSVSTAGNAKTFSFDLNTNIVNQWASAPVGWKGVGFPYDAQGNTAGNAFTPYRMGAWIRSFEADGVTMSGTGTGAKWDVTYKDKDTNIGTWDVAHDFGAKTPEPSSTALLGLGALGLVLRRRR